jgi:hypothetical protein
MCRVYLVSQDAQAGGCQLMGLGTLYPPHVLRERAAQYDARPQTCCLLAVAPGCPDFKS